MIHVSMYIQTYEVFHLRSNRNLISNLSDWDFRPSQINQKQNFFIS